MENLYFNLGKILTQEECDDLALEVFESLKKGNVVAEIDTKYYRNSFGGSTAGSWECLRRLTPLAEEKSGKKLKEANPYCRIYNNESTLHPHIDREGLDWTISVCLFTNLKHDWPLIAKTKDNFIVKFPTITGEGNLVAGRMLEHWREPLECGDAEYVVQMFLHWSEG